MSELTHNQLLDALHYDPETGIFTWLKDRGKDGRVHLVGKVAGCVCSDTGYIRIGLDRRHYLAHRLAWFYVTGEWPSQLVDHINRVKTDNRINNLRHACHYINASNVGRSKRNTSGYVGLTFFKKQKKWRAQIMVRGQYIHLGMFYDLDDAKNAYAEAAMKRDAKSVPSNPSSTCRAAGQKEGL